MSSIQGKGATHKNSMVLEKEYMQVKTIFPSSINQATVLLLWPTITEQLHIMRNIHHNLQIECPSAKTGLYGGGAFLSLDSALFWLVCLMLANNVREDYFEETTNLKGEAAVNYEEDIVIKSA
ncbi:uncharacterized protein LOC129875907 [Solanum dulcamara]|uniref:uncharacterized protein LOC129875907 n=1 Tax=Solanum dulcamara TaxID=45834 RepID=UPI0024860403|nr:uncharacterized protein LOC129875907 [Solanum dulcamara]